MHHIAQIIHIVAQIKFHAGVEHGPLPEFIEQLFITLHSQRIWSSKSQACGNLKAALVVEHGKQI
jgi:hypothetical protein